MGVVETPPQTFADIESPHCGVVYPGRQFREGAKTALCLFSAQWHGVQDVYWLARDGLTGTCVDHNAARLAEMQAVYPQGWEFVEADVFEFAQEALEQGKQWDVVNLDPWTGEFEVCADMLPLWTALASRTVILGNDCLAEPEVPEGWTRTLRIQRSDFKGGVDWLVFERDLSAA